MQKEVTRNEAIALITAAVGAVYSECFGEKKHKLSNYVRRAATVAGQIRNTEEKSQYILSQMTELNSEIGELSSEAQQVLAIFDTMVSMSSVETEELWARIRDLEQRNDSKTRVIEANNNLQKRLEVAQRALGELQIKHAKLQQSYNTMDKNFRSNANKLIERVKEVNQLKEKMSKSSVRSLKKELEAAKSEICRLQCKVGSEDWARREWKRKYAELLQKYKELSKTSGLTGRKRKAA